MSYMPYETYVNENTMKAYCVVTITNERLCKTVHKDFMSDFK
ncbi:Uncharacterised protein [Klebsiella pneumoniae]|uniref:Uncharacterized protein n=1 Tax=Klebsiella pneumoniae TaxID=573 RepID=A0A377VSM6_KLEPN|nr:Uncharacterised protein [Klebsiella pneumoniae]STT39944.1 Uncharacterised protein [Klebsiella pneumoniae]STT45413.1 Uncharacterised protein [Klebsiella pneumoniae]STU44053.1 Uncharacterised protein [Klebsiella pneumoniae]STU47473.1 Uncharacterised protein [Klebsiella pneumoniae]